MVTSVSPSVSSPFAIRDPLHPALQSAFSESCTQAKLGHFACVIFLMLLPHIREACAHRKVKA